MSALITDALRANLLEQCGYETQILEFIDMEHTPKNLLIRAVKSDKIKSRTAQSNVNEITSFLQIHPALERLVQSLD